MLIEKIALENFLSFENVIFEIGATGPLLVSGSNGAGKSSLTTKALTWGLYGQTPGGAKGGDVSSIRAPKAKTSVKIWLTVHGRPWTIERTRNPNRIEVVDVENGKEVSCRHAKDTQEYINQLLGRDLDGFLASDYFGQGIKTRFLEATAAAQQAIVEGILKLDSKLEPVIEATKGRGELLVSIKQETGQELSGAAATLQEISTQEARANSRVEELRRDLVAAESSLVPELRFPAEPAAPTLPPVPVCPEPRVETLPLPTLPALDPEERLRVAEETSAIAEEKAATLPDLRQKLKEAEEYDRSLKTYISTLEGQLATAVAGRREVHDETCPTCSQQVGREVTDALKAEQAAIEAKVQEIEGQLTLYRQAIPGSLAQVAAKEDAVQHVEQAIGQLRAAAKAAQAEASSFLVAKQAYDRIEASNKTAVDRAVAEAEAQWETEKQRHAALCTSLTEQHAAEKAAHVANIRTLTEAHAKQVAAREARIAATSSALNETISGLESLVQKKQELSERTDVLSRELSGLERQISDNSHWLKVFRTSFKQFILERCLDFLNERTAHHLALLGVPHLCVEFATTKTLKSGEARSAFQAVASTTLGGQSYSHLSGGECQMASFATGLALAELADAQSGTSSEFLVLDEPFTELDPKNCASVIQHVNSELSKTKQSVLLISNDPHLRQLVANRVEVVKDSRGVSTIEVG